MEKVVKKFVKHIVQMICKVCKNIAFVIKLMTLMVNNIGVSNIFSYMKSKTTPGLEPGIF